MRLQALIRNWLTSGPYQELAHLKSVQYGHQSVISEVLVMQKRSTINIKMWKEWKMMEPDGQTMTSVMVKTNKSLGRQNYHPPDVGMEVPTFPN